MIPYLLFFCVAGVPALFHWRRKNNAFWALAWCAFVLFIGLRHVVGGDWDGYLIITDRIADGSLLDALSQQEVLFSLTTWISTHSGLGVYGANVAGAIIFCTGLFAYCARMPNRWLALAASVPFLVLVAVMSANRQGMAIGVVLFVMSRWHEMGIVRRSVGIVIAALFHTSATLLLILSVADLKISRFRKVLISVILVAFAFWLTSRSEEIWYRYTEIYMDRGTTSVYSPGAIFHLLLNLAPAGLMLLFRRRWSAVVPNWPLIQQLCLVAFVLLALSPFFTVAVGRMSLYLFPISISFLSCLPMMLQSAPARAMLRTATVGLLAVTLAAWLAFANTAFTYLPYQSALFVDPHKLGMPR